MENDNLMGRIPRVFIALGILLSLLSIITILFAIKILFFDSNGLSLF